MPNYSEDPVKHVISFRVSDDERDCLYQVSKSLGVNISILMRESLALLAQEHKEGNWLPLTNDLAAEPSCQGMRLRENSHPRISQLLLNRVSLQTARGRKMLKRDPNVGYSSKSVKNTLAVLQIFSEAEDEIPISTLSEKLGMSKLSVFRLLATIEQCGYVEKSKKTGKYRLGLSAYEMGQKFLSREELLKKAKPVMKRLARLCNEAVYLAVPREDEVLMIDLADTLQNIGTASLVGNSYPLLQTAAGKAIQEMNTSIDVDGLGIGSASVAVPLLGANEKAVGSLCIVGPAFRFTVDRINCELLPFVKDASGVISSMLGYYGKSTKYENRN